MIEQFWQTSINLDLSMCLPLVVYTNHKCNKQRKRCIETFTQSKLEVRDVFVWMRKD